MDGCSWTLIPAVGKRWGIWEGEGNLSHLMAGHPAYEGGWGRPCEAHYLLQLVYV